jgi:hypothetical protein
VTVARAGTVRVAVTLTAKGRRMLAHARRLKVIATATFTPAGGLAVHASRTFTLRR